MTITLQKFDYHNAQVVIVELNIKTQLRTVSISRGSNILREFFRSVLTQIRNVHFNLSAMTLESEIRVSEKYQEKRFSFIISSGTIVFRLFFKYLQ